MHKTELSSMDDNILFCRSDRHAWKHVTDNVTTNRRRVTEFTRMTECIRCGTICKKVFEVPSLQIKSSTMKYPDGYLSSEGRIKPSEVRRQQLRRAGYNVRSK